MYSDGIRYLPAKKFINKISADLANVKTVLLLGTGLGSLAQLLVAKKIYPQFTFVDIDELILKWALECSGVSKFGSIIPVCCDAQEFILKNNQKYDMIFVDVFLGREVLNFVTTEEFLIKCKSSLTPTGCLGLNYIINDDSDWEKDKAVFASVFPNYDLISFDINRVFVYK